MSAVCHKYKTWVWCVTADKERISVLYYILLHNVVRTELKTRDDFQMLVELKSNTAANKFSPCWGSSNFFTLYLLQIHEQVWPWTLCLCFKTWYFVPQIFGHMEHCSCGFPCFLKCSKYWNVLNLLLSTPQISQSSTTSVVWWFPGKNPSYSMKSFLVDSSIWPRLLKLPT